MRLDLFILVLPIGGILSCSSGSSKCDESASKTCKTGTAVAQGATCKVGKWGAKVTIAACTAGAIFTFGWSCLAGIVGTAVTAGACAVDWSDACTDCTKEVSKELLEKLDKQNVDLKNMNETLARILKQTEKLNENDLKIMKILDEQGVDMKQLKKYSEQIISTLEEHGIKLDEIKVSVDKIKTKIVKLDENDQKMLGILNEHGITLEDLKQDSSRAIDILKKLGWRLDDINERLIRVTRQLEKLDENDRKIIAALYNTNITVQAIKDDTDAVVATLEGQGIHIDDIRIRLFKVMGHMEILDENDKKVISMLDKQNITINKLMGFDLKILEELEVQQIPLTNITSTVTHITHQVENLKENDKKIINILLTQDIALKQINETVKEAVDNTYKLLKGQSDIITEINRTQSSIQKMGRQMVEEFKKTNILIQYSNSIKYINRARTMLERLPTEGNEFKRYQENNDSKGQFDEFKEYVIGGGGGYGIRGWVDNLLTLLVGGEGIHDEAKTLYERLHYLCRKSIDSDERENNYVMRLVLTGMEIYQIVLGMNGQKMSEKLTLHWERDIAKARASYYRTCSCSLNSELHELRGVRSLQDMFRDARNPIEENKMSLGSIENDHQRKKAQILLDGEMNFDITDNNLNTLDDIWYEYLGIVTAMNKAGKFPASAEAVEGVQTCISTKLNPTAGKHVKCPTDDISYSGHTIDTTKIAADNLVGEGHVVDKAWQKCGKACWDKSGCEFWTYSRLTTDDNGTCKLLSTLEKKYEQDKNVWVVYSGLKNFYPRNRTIHNYLW